MYTISEILEWTGGKHNHNNFNLDLKIWGASIDTRTLKPGEMFFALKGENHNGNDYVNKAFEAGAVLCVVEDFVEEKFAENNPHDDQNFKKIQITVPNVLVALQNCAREYRKKMNKIKVVGVTGSNGKTTTKNMIAAVLSKKYKVSATKGSYNNHLGVPLSILSIKQDDEIGVFEIGMNHPGEIAPLAEIIKPQIVVVTGIGNAHVEAFEGTTYEGGPQEAIAREKAELVRPLVDGVIILPANEKFKNLISSFSPSSRLISVSNDSGDSVLYQKKLTENGFIYSSAVHMVQNALLAIAVGVECGVSIDESIDAIAKSEYEEGRLTNKKIDVDGKSMQIIDDTYNANPDSVCAGLEMLVKIRNADGKLILALGALKEMGNQLALGYQTIFNNAVSLGIDTIILCDIDWDPKIGEDFDGNRPNKLEIIHVSNQESCANKIREIYKRGDIVLLKGSKTSKMASVIQFLGVLLP